MIILERMTTLKVPEPAHIPGGACTSYQKYTPDGMYLRDRQSNAHPRRKCK